MNNYREQPEIKCCGNCKHHDKTDYQCWEVFCSIKGQSIDYISITGICDKWEKE